VQAVVIVHGYFAAQLQQALIDRCYPLILDLAKCVAFSRLYSKLFDRGSSTMIFHYTPGRHALWGTVPI
jgi:hypothetical protein